MIGNAMYRPTSNASALPALSPALPAPMRVPGTIPPSVAALISSSDASHDFIFSSRLLVDDDDDDDVTEVLIVSPDNVVSSESVAMNGMGGFVWEIMNLVYFWVDVRCDTRRDDAEVEKEWETCIMTAIRRSISGWIMMMVYVRSC